MATLVTHGHINFDESVPPEFVDLVRQTLEQSEFIETEEYEADNPLNEIILIHEVRDGDGGLDETPDGSVALAEGRTPEEAEAVRGRMAST